METSCLKNGRKTFNIKHLSSFLVAGAGDRGPLCGEGAADGGDARHVRAALDPHYCTPHFHLDPLHFHTLHASLVANKLTNISSIKQFNSSQSLVCLKEDVYSR